MRDAKGHFVKGHTPWSKGKTNVYSDETKRKMSDAKKGKPNWRKGVVGVYKHTEEWKVASSKRHKGKITSEETKKKIGEANRGERNGQWRGGVWDRNFSRLSSYQYRMFSKEVLERDKVCVKCSSDERLEVDHILPYSLYPELRLNVNNARVLCRPCHKKTSTWGTKVKQNV